MLANRTLLRTPYAVVASLVLLAAGAQPALPTNPPDSISEMGTSYETWVSTDAGPLRDEQLLKLSSSQQPTSITLPGLPADADIDAFEYLGPDHYYFSLADWAVLPGGLHVHPADIVEWNGANYFKVFDVLACGYSAGLNVDAIDLNPGFPTLVLLVSFDTMFGYVSGHGIVRVFDEDFVALEPNTCAFGAVTQLAGSERRWDLDGLASVSQWDSPLDLVDFVSYDTWVIAGGVLGSPGSVVGYRGGQWSAPAFNVKGARPTAEIDAIWIVPSPVGELFRDDYETGATDRWSATH